MLKYPRGTSRDFGLYLCTVPNPHPCLQTTGPLRNTELPYYGVLYLLCTDRSTANGPISASYYCYMQHYVVHVQVSYSACAEYYCPLYGYVSLEQSATKQVDATVHYRAQLDDGVARRPRRLPSTCRLPVISGINRACTRPCYSALRIKMAPWKWEWKWATIWEILPYLETLGRFNEPTFWSSPVCYFIYSA